ncbi:MAG: hypothetical protein FJ096_11790 [Deltaproteobacteria bacterium]|nr:hypothetical protein [Deltaproteobacteria bacterium]
MQLVARLLASSFLVLVGCSSSEAPSLEPDDRTLRTAPLAEFLPEASGTCPELEDGYVTFAPAGLPPRRVRLWFDPAVTTPGPLLFYWHGMGSKPEEATYGLGTDTLDALRAKGGIVAAPEHDPAAGQFPWFLTTGAGREDDLLVADEVLACVRAKRGVDLRRIHSVGMSAGGLQTTQFSYRRSGYVASVVTYSGGKVGFPSDQDPMNPFAAMIVHGGPKDIVILKFMDTSLAYHADLTETGRFSFVCGHTLGHKIPMDARASVGVFLDAHPFGTSPSPYASGLPAGFPAYCALD